MRKKEVTNVFCFAILKGKLIRMMTGAGRGVGKVMSHAFADAAVGGGINNMIGTPHMASWTWDSRNEL